MAPASGAAKTSRFFGHWRGRPLGTFGALATLSFHETKNVTCGEGGALVLNDRRYLERAEILLDFMTQTRSDLAALTAALIMPSLPACTRIAHRMKGSSLMVGAQALAAACESMENAARQSSIQDAAAAKPVIDRALEKLEAHIAGPAHAIGMQYEAS